MKNLDKMGGVSKTSMSRFVIWASLLTMVLYLVPFLRPLAYPFMLLSTLVHEMGHGLMAIVLGGHFDSFKLWSDGSGVASISGNFGRVSTALVAFAGLLGPALVAAIFFWGVTSREKSRFLLLSFGIALLLSIMLVIRNVFGIFFVGCTVALCFYCAIGDGKKYCQAVLAFFASQLALSVFSRSDYLFTDQAITNAGVMPSDVAVISQSLIFPYWMWGALIGVISIIVLVFGFRRSFS